MTNDEIVYQTGIDNGLPSAVATMLAAQARLESGNYTSNLYLQNNNAFGYKYVGQFGAHQGILAPKSEWNNPNVAGYYAAYDSLAKSALEVVKWIKRRIKEGVFTMEDLTNPDDYANAFKKAGYFGETAYEYSQDLASIVKHYFETAMTYVKSNPTVVIIGLIIILAAANSKRI